MPLYNQNIQSVVVNHPGFISGKYYASSQLLNSNATVQLAAGTIYYTYFFIPFSQIFTSAVFQVSTGGTSTQKLRLAIYSVKDGLPYSLIKDFGELQAPQSLFLSGYKDFSSSSFLLTPGWYAFAVSVSESSAYIVCPALSLSDLIGNSTLTTFPYNGFRAVTPYAPALAIAPTTTLVTIQSPIIWLKAA
jgi:hypothetical protein